MIYINGKTHRTIVDAAKELRVAAKTVHAYIAKAIIPTPPKVDYGIRRVQVFPPEYMRIAKRRIQERQKRNSS
jgi:hypothetical protein